MVKRLRLRCWCAVLALSAAALGAESGDVGPVDNPTPVARTTALRYLTKRVEPEYPPMARRMGVGGAVAVDAIIGEDGLVESVRTANGHPVLSHAAQSALSQWRFRPIVIGERPTRVVCRFEFEFRRR